tara:strand:- start:294 stop:791 length:498 start_codon:yes stop_codon:yes gene_type:complete
MATDANTGQPIFGGHSSWGRTRSPKNLAGTQGGEVTTVLETALVDFTADENAAVGYFTENQRYLHILLEDGISNTPQDISVFGYCHAFLRWFPLSPGLVSTETPAGAAAAVLPAPTHEGVAVGHDDFLPSGRIYRVYEIVGMDKVAFVGAANDDRTTIFAACSTF